MPKKIVIKGKEIQLNRVLIPKKNKTVENFINEITPNFERLCFIAHQNKTKPFKDKSHLKRWLINNQENYPKYSQDIFLYFADKVGL